MRLIDADKLIIDLTEILDPIERAGAIDHVIDQPTIDAVPVEFIEKEIEITREAGQSYAHCLKVLLARWERETTPGDKVAEELKRAAAAYMAGYSDGYHQACEDARAERKEE